MSTFFGPENCVEKAVHATPFQTTNHALRCSSVASIRCCPVPLPSCTCKESRFLRPIRPLVPRRHVSSDPLVHVDVPHPTVSLVASMSPVETVQIGRRINPARIQGGIHVSCTLDLDRTTTHRRRTHVARRRRGLEDVDVTWRWRCTCRRWRVR